MTTVMINLLGGIIMFFLWLSDLCSINLRESDPFGQGYNTPNGYWLVMNFAKYPHEDAIKLWYYFK